MSRSNERSYAELLQAWAEATQGLQEQGLMRLNAVTPVGGYAEYLVSTAFDAHKPEEEHPGVDLVYGDNGREQEVQVTARYVAYGAEPVKATGIRGMASRKKEEERGGPSFSELVVVLFDWDFQVRSAWKLDRDLACEILETRMFRSELSMEKLEEAEGQGREGIEEITAELREAAATLD